MATPLYSSQLFHCSTNRFHVFYGPFFFLSPTMSMSSVQPVLSETVNFSVDKKNQLDVTFCILYFSSNSCSTCFGQPCAHHQQLTTA